MMISVRSTLNPQIASEVRADGNGGLASDSKYKKEAFSSFTFLALFLAAGKICSSFMFVADIGPFCGQRRKRWGLSVSYATPEPIIEGEPGYHSVYACLLKSTGFD